MTNSRTKSTSTITTINRDEPGGGGGVWLNHAEGLVVAKTSNRDEPGANGGVWLNHAEGLVGRS